MEATYSIWPLDRTTRLSVVRNPAADGAGFQVTKRLPQPKADVRTSESRGVDGKGRVALAWRRKKLVLSATLRFQVRMRSAKKVTGRR